MSASEKLPLRKVLLQLACLAITIIKISDGQRVRTRTYESTCNVECSPRCGEGTPNNICYCDQDCEIYGDCCEVRDRACISTKVYRSQGLNPLFDCINVNPQRTSSAYYRVIGHCSRRWGRSVDEMAIKNNCDTLGQLLPPVYDTVTRYTYKNEYCAVCNSVERARPWTYQLECPESLATNRSNITQEDISEYCTVRRFLPPSRATVHKCFNLRVIDKCLSIDILANTTLGVTSDSEYSFWTEKCNQFQTLVTADRLAYRNVYCAACNGIDPNQTVCERKEQIVGEILPMGSFSLLLDINMDSLILTSKLISTTVSVSCNNNQVFDPISGTCRDVYCIGGFTLTGETCGQEPEESPTPQGRTAMTTIMTSTEGTNAFTTGSNTEVMDTTSTETTTEGNGTTDIEVTTMITPINSTSTSTTDVTLTSSSGATRSMESTSVRDDTADSPTSLPTNGQNICMNGMDVMGKECFKANFSGLYIACQYNLIVLNETEFRYLDNDTLIYGDLELDIQLYDSRGLPVVCVDFASNGTVTRNSTVEYYDYPPGYTIITYIGCSLSVLGCLLVLLTLCLFQELLTLPSKIQVNIVICILITSLLFIIGGPILGEFFNSGLCKAVAIFQHFFFVAMFTWMDIMMFEMTKTFCKAYKMRSVGSKRYQKRLFIFYLVLGWTIPVIIVAVSIIVDLSTDDRVNYGTQPEGQCWINDKTWAILTFLVVVALSVLLNTIFFVLIVTFLCIATMKKSSNTFKMHNPTDKATYYCRIIVAIFFVSGINWLVFGVSAILIGRSWAWYPFIICNSSLGIILFLAFFGSKKVFKLYFSLVERKIRSSRKRESSEGRTLKTQMSDTNIGMELAEATNKQPRLEFMNQSSNL